MKSKHQNKILIIFLAIFLLIITLNFVSSLGEVCCQQLKSGAWCQMDQQSNCAGSVFAPTSCDQTQFCRLGTCINDQSGECSANVPKVRCESSGGTFDTRTTAEIPSCRNGCCQFGDWVAFSNKAECKSIASDYGVNYNFLEDVTNEFDCYALGFPENEGACIIKDNESSTCRRMTKQECNSIQGDFNDGFLCTAPQLESPCAKTSKTMIDTDNKIYFIDSCRNKANIYDSSMYTTNANAWNPQMINYWTYIKKPEDSCNVTGSFSNTCGNCDPITTGTIGRSYKQAKENTANSQLSPPVFGDNVCASMDCYYDTNNDGTKEPYKNGEAWCAETPGTYPHLQYDFTEGFTNTTRNALAKVDKYNLPGSEYVRLYCLDGQVTAEPCAYYRNEFCAEQKDANNFKSATCLTNNGRTCIAIGNRADCEAAGMACRWIPGYRFDQTQTTTADSRYNGLDNHGKSVINKDQTQGSCVPLIPIGMNDSTENSQVCQAGSVTQTAVYETLALTTSRSAFGGAPTCSTSGAKRNSAVARCYQNCFLIPNYGKSDNSGNSGYMSISEMQNIFTGGSSTNLKDMCVSDRRGYYCDGKTGQITGASDQCQKKDSKASVFPIYWTYNEWLNSIRNKTRSLGDCGYKPSAYTGYDKIDVNLETISVVFQKIKQNGGTKDKWGNQSADIKKIYAGNNMLNNTGYRDI